MSDYIETRSFCNVDGSTFDIRRYKDGFTVGPGVLSDVNEETAREISQWIL